MKIFDAQPSRHMDWKAVKAADTPISMLDMVFMSQRRFGDDGFVNYFFHTRRNEFFASIKRYDSDVLMWFIAR